MRAKHWILLGTVAVALSCVVLVVFSLQNDDSTLSVVTRYVKAKMGLSQESAMIVEYRRMEKYEMKGRDDDAIQAGVAFVSKYPDSSLNFWIYQNLSVLYLKQARKDSGRAEEYLKQAILYRDKGLPSVSDSPYQLQRWVIISESVGDLSATQRCVQYRNAIKLLDRMNLLVNKDKDRVARQFRPDLAERTKLESMSEWIDAEGKRVAGKLPLCACQ
jgi:hypothetical protein